MKVVLLSGSNSRLAGGLYNSVRHLGLSLMHHCNVSVSYVSHNDKFTGADIKAYKDLPIAEYHISKFPLLKRFGFSNDIHKVLENESPDIIEIQGIWMYFSYAALRYKKRHPKTKIVITPRGSLDNWAANKSYLKKKVVGWLYENENLSSADCFRALCSSEYDSIRAFGLNNPVAIIPNGINVPDNPTYDRNGEKKILLFIGRIHPKKGIKELIKGLSILKMKNPSLFERWQVRIAGWDQNGHLIELKNLTRELGLGKYVEFIGPLYGAEKERELCKANAFVLTSFSEGMPMSVLEAWAYKLPIVMTDFCNLPEGFEYDAAIRVEPEPMSIANGLATLFGMPDNELQKIGNNGFDLVSNKFTWPDIAEHTLDLYNFLLNKGPKPDFVFE